jgi:hypothetical protein
MVPSPLIHIFLLLFTNISVLKENKMNDFKIVKKQVRRHWQVDLGLFLTALGASLTGIYFLFLPIGGYQGGRNPFYGITFLFERETWDLLHTWTGVAMIATVLIHLVLHWNWISGTTKRTVAEIFNNKHQMSSRNRIFIAVDLIIAIGFFLTAVSGIYFLLGPAGVSSRNTPAFIFSAQTWDLIHTWASVAMISGLMLHLALHWSWIVSVTKRCLVPESKTKSQTLPAKAQ